ncbi:MAG: DUF488 family protein [Gammaproteobacteria bacterium]
MNSSLTPHSSTLSTLYTIGHSNRALDVFIEMLRAYDIEYLVDVRTIPRSRHNPQFNRGGLPASLKEFGIGWEHRAGLGGLRHARKDSPNQGWRNASFRGYADYMQTEEFSAELEALIELASDARIAIMCAEAVPWRCHRSLIADALLVRGFAVRHIMNETTAREHALTRFAHVEGTRITYPFALDDGADV